MSKNTAAVVSIVFLILSIVLYQWQGKRHAERYKQNESVEEVVETKEKSVTPILEQAINEFGETLIDFPKKDMIYTLEFRRENDKSVMFISAEQCLDLDILEGYTYVGGYLLAYYGSEVGTEQAVLNVGSLNKGRSLLDAYKKREDVTSQYETVRCKYELVTADSIRMVDIKREVAK